MRLTNKLEAVYETFFNDLNINPETGIVQKTEKRFAAKPAIGKMYEESKNKILFISLDIGKDELYCECGINSFQDYQYRIASICDGKIKDKNPHMAGVYGIALYLLRNCNNWHQAWQLLADDSRFFREILNDKHQDLPTDVLSHISLINFYNFVKVGRKARTGDSDRTFLNRKKEVQLLRDVINILEPEQIVIHGKGIHNVFKSEIIPHLNRKTTVYPVVHPSIIGRGIHLRNPRKYIEHLEANKMVLSEMN